MMDPSAARSCGRYAPRAATAAGCGARAGAGGWPEERDKEKEADWGAAESGDRPYVECMMASRARRPMTCKGESESKRG